MKISFRSRRLGGSDDLPGPLGLRRRPELQAAQIEAPDQFSEIGSATQPTTEPSAGPATQASTRPDYQSWWETLNDRELNSLIARAVRTNPDVMAAEARIREARGDRGVTASGLFPQVNSTGGFTHSRISQNQAGNLGVERRRRQRVPVYRDRIRSLADGF